LWTEKLDTNEEVKAWWNDESPCSLTLDGLVIIVDDVGKNIPFAFGLVDISQEIKNDIIQKKKAKCALLVLVGAGLDMISMTELKLATNPRKAKVVLMQPPQKEKLERRGIVLEQLEGGTFSRVLSDNPRVPMKGILPIFESTCLSEIISQ
jgi:hypothetical protein